MAAPLALVVEDDQVVANLFQRALEDTGYQAQILENGHKAQACLMFTNPDLIVLDMNLPSLSGEVILRQVHGQGRLGRTHVIAVTGDPEEANRYVSMADQVLVKPIGYESVRQLAGNYLPVEDN